MIPYDQKRPICYEWYKNRYACFNIRGMKNQDMVFIANLIDKVLSNIESDKIINDVKSDVKELCSSFKLYENLI